MDNSELTAILDSWSSWDRPLPESVPRQISVPPLDPRFISVVQGVRRSGKSTFLRQWIHRFSLNPKNTVFVNFEDPRLADCLDHKLLEQIEQVFRALHPQEPCLVFFFDEIQNVKNWEKWLNSKLEQRTTHCFCITGSNASLLSGELSSALTGRYRKLEVFPFDFEEYKAALPTGSFADYLKEGGFPLAVLSADPFAVLRQCFDDIIERDIRERLGARSAEPLRRLVKAVFESCASEVSLRRLAGLTHLTPDTVASYLEVCESAYLLFACPFFSFSEAKTSKRNKKYYPVDTGLRRSAIVQGGEDLGKDLETLVFHQLRRVYRNVYYWRGEGELDFVVNGPQGIVPVQVSVDELSPRHEEALDEFYRAFPQAAEFQSVSLDSFETWRKGMIKEDAQDVGV